MLFLCADPEIPYDSQLPLALKTLSGFSTEEIASRFFQSTDAIHKRLQRVRARLRERGTELDMPSPPELEQRVPSILQMLYLLFNEGYSSAKPDSVIRRELCDESIRLARVLVEYPTGAVPQTDVHAPPRIPVRCSFRQRRRAPADEGTGPLKMGSIADRRGISYLRRSARGDQFSRDQVEAAIRGRALSLEGRRRELEHER